MAVSYNGWLASKNPADFGGLDNSVIPGTDGAKWAPGIRAGSCATVFAWLGWQLHTRVEPAVMPGLWGYNYRLNRNANNLSCHSSATAGDWNAPKHPNGVKGTWIGASLVPGRTKIQEVRAILAELRALAGTSRDPIRWGEDFTGTIDGMHFEVNKGIVLSDINRLANALEAKYGARTTWGGGTIVITPGTPFPSDTPNTSKWTPINMGDVTVLNSSGEQVRRDQADLIDSGFSVGGSGADGFAGQETIDGIRAAQLALFGPGDAVDGQMGPQTRDALHSIPSYGLPLGHVWGLITGPANEHGGINAAEKAQVKRLQGQLMRKGAVPGKTNPDASTWDDGRYEGATADAVRRFQSSQPGLAVDGKVGPMTWTRLFR